MVQYSGACPICPIEAQSSQCQSVCKLVQTGSGSVRNRSTVAHCRSEDVSKFRALLLGACSRCCRRNKLLGPRRPPMPIAAGPQSWAITGRLSDSGAFYGNACYIARSMVPLVSYLFVVWVLMKGDQTIGTLSWNGTRSVRFEIPKYLNAFRDHRKTASRRYRSNGEESLLYLGLFCSV